MFFFLLDLVVETLGSQGCKSALGNTLGESINTIKDFIMVSLNNILLPRTTDELLDDQNCFLIKTIHGLLNLVVNKFVEFFRRFKFILGIKFIQKARGLEILRGDGLGHEKGFAGLGHAQALQKSVACSTLGGKTNIGKGCQEVGVVSTKDQVGSSHERGTEADNGAVKRNYKNLGVIEKSLSKNQVAGTEAVGPQRALIKVGVVFGVSTVVMKVEQRDLVLSITREIALFKVGTGGEKCACRLNESHKGRFFTRCRLDQLLKSAVLGTSKRVELFGEVESDDGGALSNFIEDFSTLLIGHCIGMCKRLSVNK